jgi:hypothetical protein
MISIDTREKPHAIVRIVDYFDKNNIPHKPQKLDVGDYRLEENPAFVIDRKQNLSELATNLGADKRRFMNEIRLAAELGVKLYILCEHGGQIHTIEDVKNWENPHGLITGRELADRMVRVHISYNVEFLFCDKRCTGKRIAEILGVNP